MDRNSIIGIILIAAIFVVWGVINKPSPEQQELMKRRADSIANVRAQEAAERELRLQEAITEKSTQNTDSVELASKAQKYGALGNSVFGKNDFYTIENDLIKLTVSTKGGRPYSVELKNYQTYDSLPLVLFDGDSTEFNLQFYIDNRSRSIFTQELIFSADSNLPKTIVVSSDPKELVLRTDNSSGKYIEYKYNLSPNSYQVNMDIHMVGMEQDLSYSELNLKWGYYSPTQEKGWKNEAINSTIYYKHFIDNEVDFFNARSNKEFIEEDVKSKVSWFAYKDQFFSSILMGDKPFEGALMEIYKQPEDGKYTKRFTSNIGIPYKAGQPIGLKFYFGPNDFKYLRKNYGEEELHGIVAVGRGIIKWINQGVIINLFNWLNKYISNYGIIILLMTIIIKMFLLPLTFRSYMSQAKMRVVKPMVDEATKKIPKEKAMERQQATMAIYKKVGVSPLGGCLPMVLQMPILFAMFRFFPGSIELRQQSFLWANDLSTYDDLISWGADIPLLGNHLSLFTLLMTITTIISMKTNSTPQATDNSMPGMKTMMYIMPVTFLFVLNDFSAALTYYYFLANVITFGQNFLFKKLVNEEEVLKKLQEKKAKPKKKSKWQQRIEEMQKAQQQAAKKRK